MTKLMKELACIIIIWFVLLHLIPLIMMLMDPVVKNTIYRKTYIGTVITPEIGEEKIYKILNKFNKYGNNNAVKYKGYRPIYIHETDKLPERAIGLATILPGYCIIQLTKGLDDVRLESVVMHEYVHCFGYKHSGAPCTLMYPNICPWNTITQEVSKKYFAEQIAEKFYE